MLTRAILALAGLLYLGNEANSQEIPIVHEQVQTFNLDFLTKKIGEAKIYRTSKAETTWVTGSVDLMWPFSKVVDVYFHEKRVDNKLVESEEYINGFYAHYQFKDGVVYIHKQEGEKGELIEQKKKIGKALPPLASYDFVATMAKNRELPKEMGHKILATTTVKNIPCNSNGEELVASFYCDGRFIMNIAGLEKITFNFEDGDIKDGKAKFKSPLMPSIKYEAVPQPRYEVSYKD